MQNGKKYTVVNPIFCSKNTLDINILTSSRKNPTENFKMMWVTDKADGQRLSAQKGLNSALTVMHWCKSNVFNGITPDLQQCKKRIRPKECRQYGLAVDLVVSTLHYCKRDPHFISTSGYLICGSLEEAATRSRSRRSKWVTVRWLSFFSRICMRMVLFFKTPYIY